jgi:hypothetical protein
MNGSLNPAARRARLGLAVVVALAGRFAGAGAASAADAGIGLKPAHSNAADPATLAYFKPTVKPGTAFSDAVIVTNTGKAPVDLLVSGVDGLTAQTSGAVYANREDAVIEAGAWVRPAAPTLTVPALGTASMGFTVHVPADAAPGDHLAGVAFEDAHPTTAGQTFAVTAVVRSVMGIQIQVPGPASFELGLDGSTLEDLPGLGRAAVMVKLTNHGGKLGKPALSVTLSGPHSYAKTVDRQLDTILPGDSITYPLVWPDRLEAGDYTVAVRDGPPGASLSRKDPTHLGTTVAGATETAAPPAAAVVAPTRQSTRRPNVGFVLIGPVAVLAFGLGIILGRGGRHGRAGDRPPDLPAGETVVSRASDGRPGR